MVGKKYGSFTVLREVSPTQIECQCDCGTIRVYDGSDIKSGNIKSCGAPVHNYIDVLGQQFGDLEVLSYAGQSKWNCVCSCGNVVQLNSYMLRLGKVKSCGCKSAFYRQKSMVANGKLPNKTDEQILATKSRENLIDFIGNTKPTLHQLAARLNSNYSGLIKLISKYDLRDYVTIDRHSSRYEDELYTLVSKMSDTPVERNNRTILKGQELDIYIPDKRLAIEFNGTYWHAIPNKEPNYHQEKTIDCIKNNIRLIHIFEYEWIDDTKKAKIIHYLSDIIKGTTQIYARNTEVREVPKPELMDFEDKYHLQGSANSTKNLGLYYNNELLEIMTFGPPRFTDNYQYELIRLCTKFGYSIVGGSEKLFKYFINTFNPESIISYCDLSKFNGDLYFKLGFKATVKDLTRPNYVWISPDRNEVLTRYQTQKSRLVLIGWGTEDQTEDEIMQNLDFLKLYDSGNMRFTWEK